MTATTAHGSPPSTTKLGVCNLCEAICGLELTVEANRVTGVRGSSADPLSRGHLCPKGVALPDVHDDPDRLRRPVRRTGDAWEEIGWDEALDLVADNLARTVNTHGRDALGIYLGNPNVHSLGSMTHGTAMVKSLRTRNTYSATSVDQLPHQLVAWLMYGHQLLIPVPDIDRTSYFLVLGGNPMASNGSIMTVPDFPQRLRALKERGGRMVVIDPRRTETAKVASEHHFIRPGTDALLLLAMLHVLIEEDLTTPLAYVDDLETVRLAVREFTPELAAGSTGIDAEEIRRITREYAAADGAAAYGRVGVSTHAFGSVCQWALQCLNLLTGNVDRVGGMMFTEPAIDMVGRRLIGRGHHDLWRSRVRDLPEFAGELPVSTLSDEIETPGDGQVRAMLTLAGNPVLSTPDGKRLAEAMRSLDFMAAVDIYRNETTRLADVILPPTSSLERDHYDLVFHVLAVRNTARFTPAVLEKQADALHDWEIYREIALRTAARLTRKKPLKKRLVERVRLSVSPTRTIAALLLTGRSRVTLRTLRRHPEGVDLGPLRPDLLPARLQTQNHRVSLAPELVMSDLVRLRADAGPGSQPTDGELLLVGRRHKQDCNSWMHNTTRLTRGKARHQLLMHPDDLAARGLDDATRVSVSSRVGTVEVEVRSSDDMMPGVVSLPHGYGHSHDGMQLENAVQVPGPSINDLTDPERLDAVSGNAVFSGVPVRVLPA